MERRVGAVHLGLGRGADRVAVVVEEHDLLEGVEAFPLNAGRASWSTTPANTRGSRAASGTIRRRTAGTQRRPEQRVRQQELVAAASLLYAAS